MMRRLLGDGRYSGLGVFLISLVAGLVLGTSSVVYLETMGGHEEEAQRHAPAALEEHGGGVESIANKGAPATRTTGKNQTAGKAVDGRSTGESTDSTPSPDTTESSGQSSARNLEPELRDITSGYPGEYGVLLWQPRTGKRIALGAGERFKSASLAKLPVLLALYRDVSEGRLSLDQRIEVTDSDIQPGTGILQNRPPGTKITLRQCAGDLIQYSDNTAWAMLDRRLGKKRIRSELASAGAESTTYKYAHHTTTPEDTLMLLQKVSDPGYTSPRLSREMLTDMTGTAFEDRLPSGLPKDAVIHHKIGTLYDNFGDAGIVVPAKGEGSRGAYYIVVLSRDAGGEANARDAMREISLAAYRGLVDPEAEPRSPLPNSDALGEQARR